MRFASDGNTEIIFSQTFNIYENKLIINPFSDINVTFEFVDLLSVATESSIQLKAIDKKNLHVKLTNFTNVLGIGTTNRTNFFTSSNNENISFSIYAKTLDPAVSLRIVTVTFYKSK
jgi:hypothetical protein